jgi:hypothetical protein
MIHGRSVLVVLFLLASGCSRQPGPVHVPDDTLPPSMASFVDGAWTFIVDREAVRGKDTLPSYQFAESDYEPVSPGRTYPVVLSDNGTRLSVGSSGLVGARSDTTADRIVFTLTQWAGGRFVIWSRDHSLQAERTIYGSGVPIVTSERGRLVPAP